MFFKLMSLIQSYIGYVAGHFKETHLTIHNHATGRCHVALHVGNCIFCRIEKNSLFYDPRISRPRTFTWRFCRKFCDLYASIYGTYEQFSYDYGFEIQSWEMSLSETNIQLVQINEPCSGRSVHGYTSPNYVCLRCHRTYSPNYPLGLLIGLLYTDTPQKFFRGPEQCCGLLYTRCNTVPGGQSSQSSI